MIQSMLRSRQCIVLPLVLLTAASAAFAAESVLVQGAGVAVTATDIRADALRLPPEARKSVMTRADNVAQMGSNIFMRRALAAEAERDGLAADPVVVAALQLARDRVLYEAYMTRLDAANKPSDAALDALAASTYKINTKQFEVPAQVRARHILVAKGPDARAKAEKLLADLKAGADFATVAQEQSADTGSASKGGDLGFFGRGSMVPEFDAAVFALKQPGDMSELVDSEFGVHIIKLEASRPAGIMPFEEVREALGRDAAIKIARDARAREQDRVLKLAQPDKAAISAFAAEQQR